MRAIGWIGFCVFLALLAGLAMMGIAWFSGSDPANDPIAFPGGAGPGDGASADGTPDPGDPTVAGPSRPPRERPGWLVTGPQAPDPADPRRRGAADRLRRALEAGDAGAVQTLLLALLAEGFPPSLAAALIAECRLAFADKALLLEALLAAAGPEGSAREAVAEAFFRIGAEAQDAGFLARAFLLRPDSEDAFELLARWFPAEALRALSGLDPAYLTDGGVLLNALLLIEKEGREDLLLPFARRLFEVVPGAGYALRILLQRDPASAVPVLQERANLDPKNPEAWADLGAALLASGRRPEAFETFRKAAELDPDNPDTFQGLIETEPWAAVEILRDMAAKHPENPEAVGKLGRALMASGRKEEALPALMEAMRREPEDPEWMDLLLELDPRRTADALREWIAKKPDDDVLRGQLGRALLAGGDRGGAFEAYREAFGRRGEGWLWAHGMTEADPGGAVAVLEEAIGVPADRLAAETRAARPGEPGEPWEGDPELSPDRAALAGLLGRALVGSGRLSEGEALIEYALRTRDEDPELRPKLLGALGRANPGKASGLLRDLEREAGGDAEEWARIGESWREMGNRLDALWAYRRALALEPTNEEWITASKALGG